MNQIQISKSILITGLVILGFGFILMAIGDKSNSFSKLSLSPILLIGGYATIAYSIMHKKKNMNV